MEYTFMCGGVSLIIFIVWRVEICKFFAEVITVPAIESLLSRVNEID